MTYLGQKPRPGSMLKEQLEKRKPQKTPAEKRPGKHPEYLEKVRQLPCCVCGFPGPNDAHHLKCTGERGGALKSKDNWVLPLCRFPNGEVCHNKIEGFASKKELAWFQRKGIDPLTMASALWANRHDRLAMERVLIAHRR